jgi:MoaA/NifB/PqqE/SkfB family radical SAM enzyme
MNGDPGALPGELYVEVTNRCNSRCQTCVRTFATLEPARDLSLAEVRALVDPLPGLRRVVLHGVGEPLLNAELPAMIAYLKQRPDPPDVLFNSNAILLTPQNQEALMDAGLDEFRVSIDAAHRALYAHIRGVDAFDRVAENVAAFATRIGAAGRGPRLSLWFTAMRENLADLPALVRLAGRLGVGEVYVQRLVFYGQGLAREEQSLFHTLQAAEEAWLGEAEALAEALGVTLGASGATRPRQSLAPADARSGRFPGNDRRPWSRCRRPWTLSYVTANGNVLPCCFSPFTTRDYPGLMLGNAFQTDLAAIWQGRAYQRFRAALQSAAPPEACDRCGVFWSL